jgi:hypothetical protein
MTRHDCQYPTPPEGELLIFTDYKIGSEWTCPECGRVWKMRRRGLTKAGWKRTRKVRPLISPSAL